MLSRNLFYLLFAVGFLSCHEDQKLESEIAGIKIDLRIERFDMALKSAEARDLSALKASYPLLFPKGVPDSIWVKKINDSLQKELLNEVTGTFENTSRLRSGLVGLFQHLSYFDRSFKTPRIITLTNDVAYREKVIVTDSIVLVALDNYLGQDHPFYQNIPMYIRANMIPERIVPDIAEGFAKWRIQQTNRRTFLDEMIYFGKLLYFKDKVIPFEADHIKIGYSEDELRWAQANESAIWSYFVERELLYSTDSKLPGRFLADAPFSKFYLELDNESPGRLGQYMGWQIVRAYAERTGKSLMEVMSAQPEELFITSKFKPRR